MAETEKSKEGLDSGVDEVREIPVGGEEPGSTPETGAGAEIPASGKAQLDPIEVLQARVAELEDQRLRALAELDNYRKRMARQFEEIARSANDRLLIELLDVVDNFERALKHAGENNAGNHTNPTALKDGTELIYSQLTGLLARYDVTPMESIGKEFDPKYHDAVIHIESDEYDENIVSAEISKGYMIGNRVLRHARVAVSKGGPEEAEPEKSSD